MKNMQAQQPGRTHTLDTYRKVCKPMPDRPEVRRIISRSKKLICINTAARPGAKIDQLLP